MINLDFLFHLLVSKKLGKYFSGSTIPHIYFKDYKNEKVEVPSYDRQIKIAQTLDAITSLISLRRQQLEKLQQLAKSQFVEIFGDLADPQCKWFSCELKDACCSADDIKFGPFGTQLGKDEYTHEGIAVWEIPQINNAFMTSATDFISEDKAKQLSAYSIVSGDIAMSRKGNVGRCAIFPEHFPDGIIHSDILRIRVDRKKVLPVFMMYQLHISKAKLHR